MKRFLPDEKSEMIWIFCIAAICIFFTVLFQGKGYTLFVFLISLILIYLPEVLRDRKLYNRIEALQSSLDVTVEEMREVIHADESQLERWERGSVYLTTEQMYMLEDYLLDRYRERHEQGL